MRIVIYNISLIILLGSCASTNRIEVPKNLYGEWRLKESRCQDMVVKSSVEQKVIIYEGHLTLSVRQGECQFSNTMLYTTNGNLITATGPGDAFCSSTGCPATVSLVNQLGGKDSMDLECPIHKKGEKTYLHFRLENNERLIQFSKDHHEDDCDLTYAK